MAGFRKADIEFLKSFITCRVDRVRLAYARRSQDFPRQCILIGTHNPSGDNQYLRDDTGSRRFWCVECGQLNFPLLKSSRDQLFAEAVVRYKAGEILYIKDEEALAILRDIHREREAASPLDELLMDYIRGKTAVKNTDIIKFGLKKDLTSLSDHELHRKCIIIGQFMRKIGWIKGTNRRSAWYFAPGHQHDDIDDSPDMTPLEPVAEAEKIVEEQIQWEE
jgi:predicted P-loop ATPase